MADPPLPPSPVPLRPPPCSAMVPPYSTVPLIGAATIQTFSGGPTEGIPHTVPGCSARALRQRCWLSAAPTVAGSSAGCVILKNLGLYSTDVRAVDSYLARRLTTPGDISPPQRSSIGRASDCRVNTERGHLRVTGSIPVAESDIHFFFSLGN